MAEASIITREEVAEKVKIEKNSRGHNITVTAGSVARALQLLDETQEAIAVREGRVPPPAPIGADR